MQGQSNTSAPDFAKQYKEGIQTYLKFLPQELQNELTYRGQYNPAFTQQALDLQHQFDPSLANEQLSALQRRDPQWLALHQGLGDKVSQALQRGYVDPLQASAYANMGMLAGQVDPRYQAMYSGMAGKAGQVDPRYAAAYQKLSGLAGTVDPRQEAAYNQWAQLAGKQAQMAGQVDPARAAEYKALGQQVTGDTLRGTTADPATLRQMTQAIMSQRPGLSYGEAQDMASAVYVGQRGQALQQQRQAAGEQFLGQQSTAQQAQQSMAQGMQGLGQFYQSPSITQQKQQSLGQFSQVLDPTRMSQQSYLQGLSALDPTRMSQASLGQFYGQNSPEMQAMGLAGTFIQPSNSVTQAINSIQGVTAPSAMQYVNPNAGYQGVQYGLQNFQNQLAAQNQGSSSNPWVNALQGAASGAQYGSVGGGYGAAGGLLIGAGAGALGYPQYSTILLKTDVKKIGEQNGLDIVEFRYKGRSVHYRGVIAEQVREKYPEAVGTRNGYLTVDYDKIGVVMERQCNDCKCFKPLTDFPKASNGAQGRRSRCLECHRNYDHTLLAPRKEEHLAYHRNYYRENKEKLQIQQIMRDFKCSHAEAMRLYAIRKVTEACAICGEPPDKRGLVIDHCHRTNKIRGMLCRGCNTGLGTFGDDPLRLQKAMVYLLKYLDEEVQ